VLLFDQCPDPLKDLLVSHRGLLVVRT
jgi:hypothetical protein